MVRACPECGKSVAITPHLTWPPGSTGNHNSDVAIAQCLNCGWNSEADHDAGSCDTCQNPEIVATVTAKLKNELAMVTAQLKQAQKALTDKSAPPAPTGIPK